MISKHKPLWFLCNNICVCQFPCISSIVMEVVHYFPVFTKQLQWKETPQPVLRYLHSSSLVFDQVDSLSHTDLSYNMSPSQMSYGKA